jgi:hypothetical protein
MRFNKFLFSIIISGFSCSVVSAGSLELRLEAIDGTPVEHVNEVCMNLGNTVALVVVYISEPGWHIPVFNCEIIQEDYQGEPIGHFDISEVYWTHDWELDGYCEITPEGNVRLSAGVIIGLGQQPGIVAGNIIYWTFDCYEWNLLTLTSDMTLYEYEIDGPGKRELTFGDGISILQGTVLKWEDVNGDYFIDSLDFAEFAEAWLSRPGDGNWNGRCDFNMDDYIDAYDLTSLCGTWLCYSYDCYCKLRE